MASYTQLRGSVHLVMTSKHVFVAFILKGLTMSFLLALSLKAELLGFSFFSFWLLLWPLPLNCSTCFLVSVVMSSVVFPRSAYLLNVCKFLVWSQHNDFRFRSERPSALKLLACLKFRTRFYLPLFFKRLISSRRCRFFNHQWGANGIIGIVSGEVFDLCL